MLIHALTSPGFGEDLASVLSDLHETLVQDLSDAREPSRWPKAEVQIVASSREEPEAFATCDLAAFALRRPWLPVVLEARSVRVGPLVRPGGACYRCFLRRQEQLGHRCPIDAAIESQDLQPRIVGYLPSHVHQAAIFTQMLIETLRSDAPPRRARTSTAWASLKPNSPARQSCRSTGVRPARTPEAIGTPQTCSPASPQSVRKAPLTLPSWVDNLVGVKGA